MVRKKTLSPSGSQTPDEEYHNAHLSLHEDELTVAGMVIGEKVIVRAREGKIIIQTVERAPQEHEL